MRDIVPEPPGPHQESVWDYPRPPRIEASTETVEVLLGGRVVAVTSAALRVLETSHPPAYYLPRRSFVDGVLRAVDGTTWCEWKGQAHLLRPGHPRTHGGAGRVDLP